MNRIARTTRRTVVDPDAFSPRAHRRLRYAAAVVASAAVGVAAVPTVAVATVAGHRYGRTLFAVDGVAKNDAWAVGLTPGDRAAIRHWDGSRWQWSKRPSSPYSSVLVDVTARAADDVWAVGDMAPDQEGIPVAYALHWDGRRWHEVPSDPGLFTSEARAIDARTDDDAWIVGDAQKTPAGYVLALIQHWNGKRWRQVRAAAIGKGCDVSLDGVSATSADDAWAVGSKVCDSSEAVVEHWDGRQWSQVAVPLPKWADLSGLQDVTAIAADDIWAVGFAARGQQPAKNLTLHWNGTRWSLVPAPNPGPACDHHLSGVSGSGRDDVWASSTSSCASGTTPHMLHWDGTGWSNVPIPETGFDSPPGDGLYDVVSLSKRRAFTVGIAKTRGPSIEVGFIEQWNGRRWSLQ